MPLNAPGGVSDHGALAGLTDDDHAGYANLAGRAGSQALVGGTASGESLSLESTAHATKGYVGLAAGTVFRVPEISAPGAPASGFAYLYAKAGGSLFWRDDADQETEITATALKNIAGLTFALGDFLWFDSSNLIALAVGAARQRLQVGDSSAPGWTNEQHAIPFTRAGVLATGDEGPWVPMKFGVGLSVTEVYAVLKTGPTTAVTVEVEKCTQANIDGTPSWVSVFSTVLTIDAGERSSDTAATPAVLDGTGKVLADGDHLRMRVTDIGTDGADLTVFVVLKEV